MDFVIARVYGPGFIEGAFEEAKTRPDGGVWKYHRDDDGEVIVYQSPIKALEVVEQAESRERRAFVNNKDEQGDRDPEPFSSAWTPRSVFQDEFSAHDGRMILYSVRMISDKGLDKFILWELRKF